MDEAHALYWLNENVDGDSRTCLKDEFLKIGDPTGFELAKKFLGGWAHLNVLLRSKWFSDAWNDWQEELYQQKRATALHKIEEISIGESAQALNAAKFIAAREWEPKEETRGRPSNAEIKGKLKEHVTQLAQPREDYDRMMGNVIPMKKKG